MPALPSSSQACRRPGRGALARAAGTLAGLLALLAAAPSAAQPRPAPLPGGLLSIRQGPLCLDLNPPQVQVDGARTLMIVCDGRSTQAWRLDGGRIVHAASGRCLEVHAPDIGFDGGRIQVSACSGTPGQLWQPQGSQWVSQADGRCLEVAPSEAGITGARLQSFQCRGEAAQRFALGTAATPARDVEAGPIFSQAQAQQRCPEVCGPARWNGQWRTTVPGRMSVCGCELGAPVAVALPRPLPAPAGPVPMADARLGVLLEAMRAEGFDHARLAILQSAARDHHFTIAQLRRLIEPFAFPADRIKAVELVAPRVVDPANAFELYGAFTFDGERQQARAIFERLR